MIKIIEITYKILHRYQASHIGVPWPTMLFYAILSSNHYRSFVLSFVRRYLGSYFFIGSINTPFIFQMPLRHTLYVKTRKP